MTNRKTLQRDVKWTRVSTLRAVNQGFLIFYLLLQIRNEIRQQEDCDKSCKTSPEWTHLIRLLISNTRS